MDEETRKRLDKDVVMLWRKLSAKVDEISDYEITVLLTLSGHPAVKEREPDPKCPLCSETTDLHERRANPKGRQSPPHVCQECNIEFRP